jgi:serine/threonine protein kinase
MFDPGEIVGGKYRVDGLCSNSGGMGAVIFVTPLQTQPPFGLVLKYCRETNEEQLKRFRREVRLLGSFEGNSKVVQIVDQDLDHDPPYFVMKHYPDGDLSTLASQLQASYEVQEQVFLQLIDCLQELHSRSEFHRDIKPQNFLREGSRIVVSDFGLTTELGSGTAFTRSSVWWGTHGYIPPEFLNGGFKHADAAGDIFMVGKTIYVLLSSREPMYLVSDGIPPPLFHIIERCCNVSKDNRYQTLADLKQSLSAAYDVLLGRAGALGKVRQVLSAIEDCLKQDQKYDAQEVSQFTEHLALLEESDQIEVCRELSGRFFSIIGQKPLAGRLPAFLAIYEKLVERQDYGWGYAETIASNMRNIFRTEDAPTGEKAHALDLAIRAAIYMNRFAAMDMCRSMVTSIRDEMLGLSIASVLLKHRDTFIASTEPSECQSSSVRAALRQIQTSDQDGNS